MAHGLFVFHWSLLIAQLSQYKPLMRRDESKRIIQEQKENKQPN